MSGLVGRTLGRYEIVAFVGSGGMGDVYRARDTELGRDVAVKILPPEAAEVGTRLARFKREAQAVAQLSHPNILDIHDFGADDGVLFSVTELLEGVDLRQRLRGHPLPISKVVSIGRAVAEGLAAAHSKGIVHRDIKPANIFMTNSGHIKILDFGIAGLKQSLTGDTADGGSDVQTLTQEGQVVGTPDYMSPEQITGKPVDARSDVFSLGCVLYEMLTGKRPFSGATSGETMTSIVARDPAPLAELRPDIPGALDQLVLRCLEKEPGERFESARDLAFALEASVDGRTHSRGIARFRPFGVGRSLLAGLVGAALVAAVFVAWRLGQLWWPAAPDLPDHAFLAVVDFAAPPGDEDLTDIANGLTETVSDGLRLIERQTHGDFWVVPRRFRKPDQPWTLEAVAGQHGANLGLEGRLLPAAEGALRLELDLRVPGDPRPLRTTVIEDQIENVVTFQRDPITDVASMLGIELDPSTRTELEQSSTTVVPALTSYLTGVGRLVRAEELDAITAARSNLEEAVASDPTFTKAKAAVLRSCGAIAGKTHANDDPPDCVSALPVLESVAAADIAAAVAFVYRSRGDADTAVAFMRRAVQLRPGDAELQLQLGKDLQSVGEVAAAEEAYQLAIDLRFDFWEGYYYLGYADYVRGHYEATANAWRIAARCAPGRSNLFSNLGAVYHFLDRTADATRMFERAISLSDRSDGVALSNLGTLYFESGRYAEAVATFQKALAIDDDDYRIWGYLGWSYAAGVDPSRAIEPFERAAELAEQALADNPDNADMMADLAGYLGKLGRDQRGLELIERAISLDPQDPDVMASIGETLEDLGDRDRALEWIGRALAGGARRSKIESHPSLRDFVADPRYQELVTNLESGAGRDVS